METVMTLKKPYKKPTLVKQQTLASITAVSSTPSKEM